MGRGKTRLTAGGRFGPAEAVEVAWAMLRCTVRRLQDRRPLVLAATPDGCGPELAGRLKLVDVRLVDQGAGDLGRRLERVWQAVAPDRPVAFFGADAPDVPDAALDAIGPALAWGDVAVGPTPDGGYWTLAAGRYLPAVLRDIDWGTASVYDQTRLRALEAGLRFQTLSTWPDVDRPEDLDALRQRLTCLPAAAGPDPGPLGRLAERLDLLCSVTPPGTTP